MWVIWNSHVFPIWKKNKLVTTWWQGCYNPVTLWPLCYHLVCLLPHAPFHLWQPCCGRVTLFLSNQNVIGSTLSESVTFDEKYRSTSAFPCGCCALFSRSSFHRCSITLSRCLNLFNGGDPWSHSSWETAKGESHWLGVLDPFLTSCGWTRHKFLNNQYILVVEKLRSTTKIKSMPTKAV